MKNLFVGGMLIFAVCSGVVAGASFVRFADVPINAWFAPAVNRLAEIGILQGYPDGLFRPGDSVNRAEVAVVIDRLLNYWEDEDDDESGVDNGMKDSADEKEIGDETGGDDDVKNSADEKKDFDSTKTDDGVPPPATEKEDGKEKIENIEASFYGFDRDPDVFEDFQSISAFWHPPSPRLTQWDFELIADAEAKNSSAIKLYLPGDPFAEKNYRRGTIGASQISSKEKMGFGTYFVRAKAGAASCAENEEIINGIFTYFSDGVTADEHAPINSEIDIEFVCSDPHRISLTVWTNYDDHTGSARKVSRVVDMRNGQYIETSPGMEHAFGGASYGVFGTVEKVALAGHDFNPVENYYEMGFEWAPENVVFFIFLNEEKITLWDFSESGRDSSFIPKHEAYFMLNVWRPSHRWWNVDSAVKVGYPGEDSSLIVDWFAYWKL